MKKTLALLLVAVLCLSVLAACGKKPAEPETEPAEASPYAASIELFKGDWNGCVKFADGTGKYESLNGDIVGALARFIIADDGTVTPFIGLDVEDTPIENLTAKFAEDGTMLLTGKWISADFTDAVLSENNGTISTTLSVSKEAGAISLVFNFRRLDDKGWTDEDPGMGASQINACKGKTFDELAEMIGYSASDYPAAAAEEPDTQAAPADDNGGKAASGSIVGSWEYTSGGYVYTFNADGTGNYSAGSTVMEFTYTDKGDSVEILYTGNTMANVFKYTVSGDTLSIEDSFGEKVEYTKK